MADFLKAGDRYFMALVDVHDAKHSLESIIEGTRQHELVPSIELMSSAIKKLMDAMLKTQQALRSDPRYKIERGCQRRCGYTAQLHICGRAECESGENSD